MTAAAIAFTFTGWDCALIFVVCFFAVLLGGRLR